MKHVKYSYYYSSGIDIIRYIKIKKINFTIRRITIIYCDYTGIYSIQSFKAGKKFLKSLLERIETYGIKISRKEWYKEIRKLNNHAKPILCMLR